jgi:hypothetical protein
MNVNLRNVKNASPTSHPSERVCHPAKGLKKELRLENAEMNGGVMKSDIDGTEMVMPNKHERGVTPPKNEAHVDHNVPRSKDRVAHPSERVCHPTVVPPSQRCRIVVVQFIRRFSALHLNSLTAKELSRDASREQFIDIA